MKKILGIYLAVLLVSCSTDVVEKKSPADLSFTIERVNSIDSYKSYAKEVKQTANSTYWLEGYPQGTIVLKREKKYEVALENGTVLHVSIVFWNTETDLNKLQLNTDRSWSYKSIDDDEKFFTGFSQARVDFGNHGMSTFKATNNFRVTTKRVIDQGIFKIIVFIEFEGDSIYWYGTSEGDYYKISDGKLNGVFF